MEKDNSLEYKFPARNERKSSTATHMSRSRLVICPTTGGSFEVTLPRFETVQGLKTMLSRRLKIPQNRINLLHRDRILMSGSLLDNEIGDRSQIVLAPAMESGFSYPREDSSVMQALESLSETQVNDFLSGRAPLVLAMRLGDHMMFIQLQLSMSQCNTRRARPCPVTVPNPRHQVQDHQEIPSPTPENSSTTQSPIHQFSNFSRSSPDSHSSESSRPNPAQQFFSPDKPVPPPPATGAVIDSMHHLGGGVYSGKFSGTIDPKIQENGGRRDVSTILHILKDLLGATPQYRQHQGLFQQQTSANTGIRHQRRNGVQGETLKGSEKGETQLREKVRQIQRKLEEHKFKRKERRCMHAPYNWNRHHAIYHQRKETRSQGHVDSKSPSKAEQVMEVSDGVPVTTASFAGNPQTREQDTLAV